MQEFEMTDFSYFTGIEFVTTSKGMFIYSSLRNLCHTKSYIAYNVW